MGEKNPVRRPPPLVTAAAATAVGVDDFGYLVAPDDDPEPADLPLPPPRAEEVVGGTPRSCNILRVHSYRRISDTAPSDSDDGVAPPPLPPASASPWRWWWWGWVEACDIPSSSVVEAKDEGRGPFERRSRIGNSIPSNIIPRKAMVVDESVGADRRHRCRPTINISEMALLLEGASERDAG